LFFNNLSRVCEEKGTTIWEVLKELGMSRASGTYWKNGRLPNLDTVIKIAGFLDTTVSELLKGEGEDAEIEKTG
jgi:transcriptional regulator with XRE-family HTH domain